MPPAADLMGRDGLRIFTRPRPRSAFRRFFQKQPIETRVVLASLSDATDLLRRLLDGGHSVVAGRLAGAFRRIGRGEVADEIVSTMKAASFDVRESDPFAAGAPMVVPAAVPPIVARLNAMWESMRGHVIEALAPAPGLPRGRQSYLRLVDDVYQSDAYHSLSIKGYSVSMELIERVRAGDWNPEDHDGDRKNRDALAARGYWQAFQVVRRRSNSVRVPSPTTTRTGTGAWPGF
jgi:hypothetical protein